MMITNEEILNMARQADVQIRIYCDDIGVPMLELEEFAKLVADKATAIEREACAKLIEEYKYWLGRTAKEDIAKAIRARNTQECCGNPFKCEGNCVEHCVEHCVDKVQP